MQHSLSDRIQKRFLVGVFALKVAVGMFVVVACRVLLVYGAVLLLVQVFCRMYSGIWIALPASYFLHSSAYIHTGIFHYSVGFSSDARVAASEWMFKLVPSLSEYVPDWFESPHTWLGIHRMIMSTLDFVSAPIAIAMIALPVHVIALRMGEIAAEKIAWLEP